MMYLFLHEFNKLALWMVTELFSYRWMSTLKDDKFNIFALPRPREPLELEPYTYSAGTPTKLI